MCVRNEKGEHMIIGGIEAGGTKMVCAVGDEQGRLIDRTIIPTEQAETTIPKIICYFKKWKLDALGIACFGPIDLNKDSRTYGYITKTPKKGWENFPMVKTFESELDIPIGFDTDVNGAVLGEVEYGAAKGCECAIYITIGTGIGVGVYCNGKLLHGLVHPEGGHILIPKHPKDQYEGSCPYHKRCFEGVASGSAIEKRWGKRAAELWDQSIVWEMEAYYIAEAITNYILTYSPEKIILWGGVMHQKQLFNMVRQKTKEKLNGYVYHHMILGQMEHYIVAPELGENPGIIGALCLGRRAINISSMKKER